MSTPFSLENSQQFYQDMLVWDGHAGIFPSPDVDLNKLIEWHESGANYISINVGFDVMNFEQTMATLAAYRRWFATSPHKDIILASTVADVIQAKKDNKLAVTFDIEGVNALNGNADMVRVYHALGVRQMLLSYNLNNKAAGGCHGEDMGLTEFGQQVVGEMNDVGMIIDCSHTAYKTTMDMMALSSKPVVFSHSNPKNICDHQRNILDEQIKACANTGGLVGVVGMGIFLGNNESTTENYLKHICYLADLVGAEHVGFGLDYSPKMDLDVGEILRSRPDFWPPGNAYDTKDIGHYSPAQFHELLEAMMKKGFSQHEVEGIFGDNFMRVAKAVWAA